MPAASSAPAATPQAFRFLRASEGVEAYRLEANGLEVLVLPEAAVPVVCFMVTYRVGSRNETLGLTGATHFLEHLMFKGTARFGKRTGNSVFNALQRVGAQLNATTWLDRTNYYALLPREHLALAVEIEADRMRGALLEPEDVEAERTVILNEFDRGENEPLRKLSHSVWAAAFVAHPYHHPTIGWRSDIETVTREGLKHFYDTFYWPDNATVSVIGDVATAEALRLVEAHFGALPAAPQALPEVTTREPEQQGERRVEVRQAGQLGALMLAYKIPPARHADVDALDVLALVLAGGKSSRLHRHLTDAGLATHVFASATRLRDPGLFSVYALLAPGRTHDAVEEALREAIAAVQAEGVAEAEVARARTKLRAQAAFERDGPFSVAARLNEAIAAGDWTLYTTAVERIDRVSAADVQRVAQAYLLPERCTVGRYVPTS